ncbi:MAG: c-type cytochrome [Pseudomonadales bacterium]|nr:c-type cytochrome [Pseudomonadales bacterium]
MRRNAKLLIILFSSLLLLGNTTFADHRKGQLLKKARYTAISKLPEKLVSTARKEKLLGKALFFDENLSEPAGQSCASCHSPKFAFTDPDKQPAVSAGAHPDRFVSRNSPTVMYSRFTPPLHFDEEEGLWIGGLFLDGRAATLEDQAKLPFLGAMEMANPDAETVVNKVNRAAYAPLFKALYGEDIFDTGEAAFDKIAQAIAAFERTQQFSPFRSKYDYFLAGIITLSAQEQLGLEIFEAEEKGNCAACHPAQASDNGQAPLFTDFSYDNIGIAKNANNPFLSQDREFNPEGENFVDIGLGATVEDPAENGKFRVPTLRNVGITGPYMHNGIFTTLKEVVEFYNTRDTDKRWGEAEVPSTVNHDELGALQLSEEEVDALVAFLETLTDGYHPGKSRPGM